MTLAGRRASAKREADADRRTTVADTKAGALLTSTSILAHAGQFDHEVVCVFSYIGKGLPQITCLNACVNLVELNLSDNLITKIEGLEGLVRLKTLTLTSNKIREVENLESLESLEHLLLQNNQISTFDQLNLPMLGFLPKLKSLYLKNVDGSQSNQICREANYRKTVLSYLPDLRNLDGERLRSVANAAYRNVTKDKANGGGEDGEEEEGEGMFGTGTRWCAAGFWDMDSAPDMSFRVAVDRFREVANECKNLNNSAKLLLGKFASMPKTALSPN